MLWGTKWLLLNDCRSWIIRPWRIFLLFKLKPIFSKYYMKYLLFTFKSKHLPHQLYKLHRNENSIAESNMEFVIRVLSFFPFLKQTGTNWTGTLLFERLKGCHPRILSLAWLSLSFYDAEDMFPLYIEHVVSTQSSGDTVSASLGQFFALGTKRQATQRLPFFFSTTHELVMWLMNKMDA